MTPVAGEKRRCGESAESHALPFISTPELLSRSTERRPSNIRPCFAFCWPSVPGGPGGGARVDESRAVGRPDELAENPTAVRRPVDLPRANAWNHHCAVGHAAREEHRDERRLYMRDEECKVPLL